MPSVVEPFKKLIIYIHVINAVSALPRFRQIHIIRPAFYTPTPNSSLPYATFSNLRETSTHFAPPSRICF
jgi:hypothetical protein